MRKLIRIGFFRELPYGEFSGENLRCCIFQLHSDNLERVISYLKSGVVCVVAPGLSRDVLSAGHEIIGSLALRTDGVFLWPGDLSYYVEKYRVSLPRTFLEHMSANNWTVPTVDITALEL